MIFSIFGKCSEGLGGVLAAVELPSLEKANSLAQQVLDHIGKKEGVMYVVTDVRECSYMTNVDGFQWQSWGIASPPGQ